MTEHSHEMAGGTVFLMKYDGIEGFTLTTDDGGAPGDPPFIDILPEEVGDFIRFLEETLADV